MMEEKKKKKKPKKNNLKQQERFHLGPDEQAPVAEKNTEGKVCVCMPLRWVMSEPIPLGPEGYLSLWEWVPP